MTQTLRYIFFFITLAFLFSASSAVIAAPPSPEAAANKNIISGGVRATEKAAFGKETTSATGVSRIVGRLINVMLALLGTIFIVLLTSAGYKWMTAAGNEEEVTKAKSMITQAVIGLIIILAAYLITNFVIEALKEATKE